jgi:predicted transposase YdaD
MKESVIYQEILQEGKAEGEAKAANQIALNMLRSNIALDVFAKLTGLTLKQVQKLQKLSIKQTKPAKSSKPKRRDAS